MATQTFHDVSTDPWGHEREQELRERRLGDYQVRPLTPSDIDRAAREVATIGAFPRMSKGIVNYDHGLTGARWTRGLEDLAVVGEEGDLRPGFQGGTVLVRMPESFDHDSCRRAVLNALEVARVETRGIRDDAREGESLACRIEARRAELELEALEVVDAA